MAAQVAARALTVHGVHRDDRTTRPSSAVGAPRWMRVGSIAAIGVLAGALLVNHRILWDAGAHLRAGSATAVAGLLFLVVVHKLSHAGMLKISVDGVAFRQAVVASEVFSGCSNAMVGGSGVATGLKFAMFRSWGVSRDNVAASILATAVAPGLAIWALLFAQSVPTAVHSRDRTAAVLALVGAVAFAVHVAFWWLVLRRPGPARRLGRLIARIAVATEQTRLPVPAKLRQLAKRADPITHLEVIRRQALHLGKRRGLRIVVVALISQLLLAAVLVACIRAVSDGPSGVSTIEVLEAFAVARALATLVPVPGGLGVLDAGLVTLLTQAGAQSSPAVAAIIIYRVMTFLLPMATGVIAAAFWRREMNNIPRERSVGDAVLAVESVHGESPKILPQAS